jgi:hypothetical protein
MRKIVRENGVENCESEKKKGRHVNVAVVSHKTQKKQVRLSIAAVTLRVDARQAVV